MKNLILLLSIFIFGSCEPKVSQPEHIILAKLPADFGTCYYQYAYNGKYNYFKDSCNKYNVGDTIK